MTLPTSYFDQIYAASTDPWGFATRAYEARKYAITLACLPRARYRRAFEPGCSIGVFTRLLAARVDEVVASDSSCQALELARAQGQPSNVEFVCHALPKEWPKGRFDLIVFSEVGYYLDTADLDRFVALAATSLDPDGHLVAVHWRMPVADYPQSGEEVHARLRMVSSLAPLAHYEDVHFLLDVFGSSDRAALQGPESSA
jgi:SAM-dependent methyltransferase